MDNKTRELTNEMTIELLNELNGFKSMEIDQSEMEDMLTSYDVDGNGLINFEEFLCIISSFYIVFR